MSDRARNWLGNLGLLLGALTAVLLFFELVLFRYVLKPDDVIHNVSIDGVVRYVPGTRAVLRHPDKSTSLITINAQGWNSTKPDYALVKVPGTQRIAVVGDSYVHGGFINVDKGFPEVLEQELNLRKSPSGNTSEVLRFGIDGAPLSQYLHVMRSEVLKYQPDVVVIPIIHNDFDESYRFMHTRTGSSFMKLAQDAQGRVIELPPSDFKKGMADQLRSFATFRYLYYKTNAYLKLKWLISKVYWGGSAEWNEAFISSAVDIRNLQGQDRELELFTRHVLTELKGLSEQHGFRLVLTMDAVREAIYADRDPQSYAVGKLNALMARLTQELGLSFVDLHGAFETDWKRNRTRLEFPFDWHWNELGNDLVASVIADQILKPRMTVPVPAVASPPAVQAPSTGRSRSAKAAAKGTARRPPDDSVKTRITVPPPLHNPPATNARNPAANEDRFNFYVRQLKGVGT